MTTDAGLLSPVEMPSPAGRRDRRPAGKRRSSLKPSRKTKIKVIGWPLVILSGLSYLDHATVKAQTPAQCAKGQLSISVPRTHLAGWAPDGPAIRDVVAMKMPDVPISVFVKMNRLSGPMGHIPAVSGGIACLDKPKTTTIAPQTLILPGVKPGAYRAPSKRYYSDVDIARLAQAVGFPRTSLVTAVAVALAESGGDRHARCYNNGHGCDKHASAHTLSTDKCLWQINDRAHPWSMRGDIDEPITCGKAALRISSHGKTWVPWSTYRHGHGSFRHYLARAQRAVAQITQG